MKNIKIKEASKFLEGKISEKPIIGIILGSGLGELAEQVEDRVLVKYSEVPHLPESTVKGHAGQFVFGNLEGCPVVLMQGRFHYYEGNKMEDLSLPVYIMKELGVKILIVTNAAGGANLDFEPGNLMLINDHINFALTNPLIGKNYEELGPRFPDMSEPYDRILIKEAHKVARENSVVLREGCYMMFSGPTYETPAEVRMARIMGADAVGMSTVPEVIAAKHCGLKVLGISCITNMAAGILDQPLSHTEVIETSARVKNTFITIVKGCIRQFYKEELY